MGGARGGWREEEKREEEGSHWKKRPRQWSFQVSVQRERIQEAILCHVVNLESIIYHQSPGEYELSDDSLLRSSCCSVGL